MISARAPSGGYMTTRLSSMMFFAQSPLDQTFRDVMGKPLKFEKICLCTTKISLRLPTVIEKLQIYDLTGDKRKSGICFKKI